jgi:hypothetical protein
MHIFKKIAIKCRTLNLNLHKLYLNDADNFDDFEDTRINTAIHTISATITSKSKNGISDGMIAFRAQSSARGKDTLMLEATIDTSAIT